MLNRLSLIEFLHKEAEITLEVEQSDIPIKDNVMASDNPIEDSKAEKWVRDELNNGNVWAWADVTVKAKWENFVGTDHLGGCSYLNENEFKSPGGYYGDMVDMVVLELADNIMMSYDAVRKIVGI